MSISFVMNKSNEMRDVTKERLLVMLQDLNWRDSVTDIVKNYPIAKSIFRNLIGDTNVLQTGDHAHGKQPCIHTSFPALQPTNLTCLSVIGSNNSSSEGYSSRTSSVAHISMNPFSRAHPSIWFMQLEAKFKLANLFDERTQFLTLFSQLPEDLLTEFPTNIGSYKELKTFIMQHLFKKPVTCSYSHIHSPNSL